MTEPTLRDCTDPAVWWPHIDEAVRTLARGALAVIPTDTVYGIAADAFTPAAVQALLDAKGRGRQMPPPVLIGDVRTLDGLALDVTQEVRDLVEAFWPGPLTIIVNAQPSLMWDLGETQGTVALRMPDNELTLALLRRTGPLAVSSANKSGRRAARTASDAARQLRHAVSLYLDNGRTRGAVPSTIVDATGPELRIVREGALRPAKLGAVVPSLGPQPEPDPEPEVTELEDAPEAAGLEPAPEGGEGETEPEVVEAEPEDATEPAPEADGEESAPVAVEPEPVAVEPGAAGEAERPEVEPEPEVVEPDAAGEAERPKVEPDPEAVEPGAAGEAERPEVDPESGAVQETPKTDKTSAVGEATLEFEPEPEAEPESERPPVPETQEPDEGSGAAEESVEGSGAAEESPEEPDTTESHAGESTAP